MSNIVDLKNQAASLAELTFKLQKICHEKDVFFTKQFELTSMEFRCLKYLKDHNFLSVKELAANMCLTPSRITYIITSLEKKSLIEREIDKKDRRNIRLKLNDKSLQFVNDIDEKHVLLHADIFVELDNKDRESILFSLEKMYDIIKDWSDRNIKKTKI